MLLTLDQEKPVKNQLTDKDLINGKFQ